jgi:hypothetical protein
MQHLQNRSRRCVAVGQHTDRLMQLRIERNVGFIVSPKPERAQQADRLVTDDPDAFDDRARVRVGVLKSALEIVHNGQPSGRYSGTLIRSRVNDLTLATLADIVCVGERASQAILQVNDPVIGDLVRLGMGRCRVGLLWGNVTRRLRSLLASPRRGRLRSTPARPIGRSLGRPPRQFRVVVGPGHGHLSLE